MIVITIIKNHQTYEAFNNWLEKNKEWLRIVFHYTKHSDTKAVKFHICHSCNPDYKETIELLNIINEHENIGCLDCSFVDKCKSVKL